MDKRQLIGANNTLLLTEIENIFEELLPCEVQGHDAEADGEWYVKKACSHCLHTVTLLICNIHAAMIRGYLRENVPVNCMECGLVGNMTDFFTAPISRKSLG